MCVFVYGVKEQVVEEPYVESILGIEAVVNLQLNEKIFPLASEGMGDIVPQAFDAGIVDTSD